MPTCNCCCCPGSSASDDGGGRRVRLGFNAGPRAAQLPPGLALLLARTLATVGIEAARDPALWGSVQMLFFL